MQPDLFKYFKYFKPVKVFLINLSLIILLFITAIYLGVYLRTNNLLLRTARNQAASYFDLIVTTRSWNAQYGGVFVEKKGDVKTNPYLRKVGVEPDIRCEDGKVLTLRNPAAMTGEISDLTNKKSGVKFNITSLKLINPDNAPDPFEQKALLKFERGSTVVWEIDRKAEQPALRYMKPLFIEQPCLRCHKSLGYKLGDIRGGISVSVPLRELDQTMKTNRVIILSLSTITLGLLLGTSYLMARQLVRRLDAAQEQLREISITDELTGLRNRRYIVERLKEEIKRTKRSAKPLGVIMIDIDHFKQVNDTHGHAFGDAVLKTIARRIRANLREYDLVGRFGGEEFLVICPEFSFDATSELAERICGIIRIKTITEGTTEVSATVSAGATILNKDDSNIDAVISRADNALYRAKEQGRDRVVAL